eukprot:scaffold68985_cov35-Cyclotella_meneghiniana.AAC.1
MCGWGAIVVNDKAEFAISSVSWVESCWLRRRNDACCSAKSKAARYYNIERNDVEEKDKTARLTK